MISAQPFFSAAVKTVTEKPPPRTFKGAKPPKESLSELLREILTLQSIPLIVLRVEELSHNVTFCINIYLPSGFGIVNNLMCENVLCFYVN